MNKKLIREVLLNGDFCDTNNDKGFDIGVGYGRGTKKEFFYPFSERMERLYCHVTIDEIKEVVEELKANGYEFEKEGEYIFMKGERKAFKDFVPFKTQRKNVKNSLNPNTDAVGYYSDTLFTNSKDGNLKLW